MRYWLDEVEPWSTASAGAYVLVGAFVALGGGEPEAWVLGSVIVALGLATAAFHGTGQAASARDADQALMNGVYLALATYGVGAGWLWLLVAVILGLVVEVIYDMRNHALMVGMVWVAMVAALTGGRLWYGVLGTALILIGVLAHELEHRRPDIYHSAWHVLTAVGTGVLYVAL